MGYSKEHSEHIQAGLSSQSYKIDQDLYHILPCQKIGVCLHKKSMRTTNIARWRTIGSILKWIPHSMGRSLKMKHSGTFTNDKNGKDDAN